MCPTGRMLFLEWDGVADVKTGENFGDVITGPELDEDDLERGSRGMELSDLVAFGGNLYSCEDRTGRVFRIVNDEAVPWLDLVDEISPLKDKGMKEHMIDPSKLQVH